MDKGKILTVNGPLVPEKLGVTLPHEHVFCALPTFQEPESCVERELAYSPVSLENMWWLRHHMFDSFHNTRLDNYQEAVTEIMRFKAEGGTTIVDATAKGLGGNPLYVRRVSNETGVNIVMGTGYYISKTHPIEMSERTVDDIAEEFERDITVGIDGTDVRAGIMCELGVGGTGSTFSPLAIHKNEEKVLRAAARAQLNTGVAISVHPPRKKDATYPSSRWGMDILDILREEGGMLDKVVIDHMDRSIIEDLRYQLEIVKKGAYVEYDNWGIEGFYLQRAKEGWPSDVQRAESIRKLVDAGCVEKILLSQDVCMKMQLTRYGGFGYGHLLRDCVPMLVGAGLTKDQIRTILIENPKRLLQIA